MRNIILLMVMTLLFSCTQKKISVQDESKNETGLKYLNMHDKQFVDIMNGYIKDVETYPIEKHKEILIHFYIDINDTIFNFINIPPADCSNLLGYSEYRNYGLFFYTEKELENRFYDFISDTGKRVKDCKSYLGEMKVHLPYEDNYTLKGSQIIQQTVPLEMQTGDK